MYRNACHLRYFSCHAAAELNEFVRHYESLHLSANVTTETKEKVTSKFQFRSHGRYGHIPAAGRVDNIPVN